MEQYLKPKFISIAVIIAAFITLVGVMLSANSRVAEGLSPVNIVLYGLVGIMFIVGGLPINYSRRTYHIFLGLNTALIIALFWYEPTVNDGVITFFFVLSAYAALTLPLIPAYLWIAVFYIASIVSVALIFDVQAVVNVLGAGGGFFFFGLFGTILRQTNAATLKEQELTKQLQETNEQLIASQQQAEQAAIFEERNRLAREMHDSLGHRLTVAVVQLEGAQRLIPKDPERAATMIGDMRTQLKDGLGELRQTLSALRTSESSNSPADINLQASIRDLASTFSKATNLPISLDLATDLPSLSELQRHTLFRAAQEGLTNIERHANATEGWVSLSSENKQVVLTVEDNGRGISAEIPEGRFGLQGLRERAEQVGGSCTIDARQPRGTRLTFMLTVTE